MDSKGIRSTTGDAGGVFLTKPAPRRPTLALPPPNPRDVLRKTSEATPSPMTLASNFFAEQDPAADCKSFSRLLFGATTSPTSQSTECSNNTDTIADSTENHTSIGDESVAGLEGRLAPRNLGNKEREGNTNPGVARSSTARFKTMMPSRLPIPRSPFVTIPPGLSPATLLDSPVLVSAGQAEPSPTTGNFPLPHFNHVSACTSVFALDSSNGKSLNQDENPSFVFRPSPKLGKDPLSSFAGLSTFDYSHHRGQDQKQGQSAPASASTNLTLRSVSMGIPVSSVNTADSVPSLQCRRLKEVAASSELCEKVQHSHLPNPPPLVERPSEDGYNWRKYGQKHVKGSEYPRSYYKCTHSNCPVKKNMERSFDGQVTEIVYKGEHNHPRPHATRRVAMNPAHIPDGGGRDVFHPTISGEKLEGFHAVVKAEVSADQSDSKSRMMSMISDPSLPSRVLSVGASGATEPSCGSTSRDEDEDTNEPDSKRRKDEKEAILGAPLWTIRESRVVVQTTSDVDILDDGYRWRKYGQKVVKGNPHPRSYYKCTNLGCLVRKLVERSSTDSKAVITTYEGKHNHDVPAARNRNHDTSVSTVNSAIYLMPSHVGVGDSTLKLDGTKVADGMPVGFGFHIGGITRELLAFNQQDGRGQGDVGISSQALNLGIAGNGQLEGNKTFGQGLVLRSKEEKMDGNSYAGSLEPTLSSSSCQGRLVLNT
eukprot:c27962_g3_i2 orf=553-2679(+)